MLKRQELEGEKNDGLNTRNKLLPSLSEGLALSTSNVAQKRNRGKIMPLKEACARLQRTMTTLKTQ